MRAEGGTTAANDAAGARDTIQRHPGHAGGCNGTKGGANSGASREFISRNLNSVTDTEPNQEGASRAKHSALDRSASLPTKSLKGQAA